MPDPTDPNDPKPPSDALTRHQPGAGGLIQAVQPTLTPADEASLGALWRGAKATATQRAYRSDWADWEAWCRQVGHQPLPGHPESVALYLAHRQATLAPSTLQRRVAAIAWVHAGMRRPSPCADPRVSMALSAIRRASTRRPAKKQAIDRALLRRMVATLPAHGQGLRDRALLLVGWHGAFRRSEFVALQVSHVNWQPAGLVIRLDKSKTDQEQAGRLVPIEATGDALCPVAALRAWMTAAGIVTGTIFRGAADPTALTDPAVSDKAVSRLVKRCAGALGLDPAPYGAHSLRAGYVTQKLRDGYKLEEVAKVTGHRQLDTVLGYQREADPFAGSSAGPAGRPGGVPGASSAPGSVTLATVLPLASAAELARLSRYRVTAVLLPAGGALTDRGLRWMDSQGLQPVAVGVEIRDSGHSMSLCRPGDPASEILVHLAAGRRVLLLASPAGLPDAVGLLFYPEGSV